MKNNANQENDNVLEVKFRSLSFKQGLKKPTIPPGANYRARDVIPALDKDGNNDPFKKYFYYSSKLWTIYKKKKSDSAPWYFKGWTKHGRIHRSCEFAKTSLAMDHAITSWLAEDDPEAVAAARKKQPNLPKCESLFETIKLIKPEIKNDKNCHAAKTLRCAMTLCESLYPKKTYDQIPVEHLFSTTLFTRYRDYRIERDATPLIAIHGKDSFEFRRARKKAIAAAAKMVKMGKGVLWDIDGPLKRRLEEHGLNLNWDKLNEFKLERITGLTFEGQFTAPSDEAIKTTFKNIEAYASMDYIEDRDKTWSRRQQYVASRKDLRRIHVYLLFWGICGSGLRLKEMCNQQKNSIKTIDGKLNFTGIGKNDEEFQIPLIIAAAKKIKPWLAKLPDEYLLGPTYLYRYEVVGSELRRLMRLWGWETTNLLHELRAYCGWKIYEKDPSAAQQFMRHKSIQITDKYYVGRYMTRKAADVKLF
jgi:integrase